MLATIICIFTITITTIIFVRIIDVQKIEYLKEVTEISGENLRTHLLYTKTLSENIKLLEEKIELIERFKEVE